MGATIKVFHIVKLRGIGGVQSQFQIFFSQLAHRSGIVHYLVNLSAVDAAYESLRKDAGSLLRKILIYKFSKVTVIHSYNNLTSKKFYYLYCILRPRNLIFHERGNAWNISADKGSIVRHNADKSKLIICNSQASATILAQKFKVNPSKLRVIYNGVISDEMLAAVNSTPKNQNSKFIVGYVGRLESNKGVHSLIKAMQHLDPDIFELHVMGDGSLRALLEDLCKELELTSVRFLGRVETAWEAMRYFDVLVVPSIREPLGNVVIEGALHKIPIIASAVDGIPEIVVNANHGVLLTPTLKIDSKFTSSSVPVPDCVVDAGGERLRHPLELSGSQIASAIAEVRSDAVSARVRAEALYRSVIAKFHVDTYTRNVEEVYREVVG